MSFRLADSTVKQTPRSSWANVAFIVEAMLLLVFLIVSLAVFLQMFSAALVRSSEAEQTTRAVAAASSVAERFVAAPLAADDSYDEGTLHVTCDVTPENHARGTLYTADIAVFDTASQTAGTGPLYTLTVCAYESGGR